MWDQQCPYCFRWFLSRELYNHIKDTPKCASYLARDPRRTLENFEPHDSHRDAGEKRGKQETERREGHDA